MVRYYQDVTDESLGLVAVELSTDICGGVAEYGSDFCEPGYLADGNFCYPPSP